MRTSPTFIQWWKEIRAVLPVWALVMAAMWLPDLLGPSWRGVIGSGWQMVAFLFGSALVAATVWCRDFQDRTMIWQLVQPVRRMSVFGRKLLVLLPALGIMAVLFLHLGERAYINKGDLFVAFLILIAPSSVCFWGMLLRKVLNTAVCSFVAPLLLILVFYPILGPLIQVLAAGGEAVSQDEAAALVVGGFLSSYAAAAGIVSLFLWQRMQLTGGGRTMAVIDVRWTSRLSNDRELRLRPWWLALIRKELGVVRFSFWIAAFFGVVMVLILIADVSLGALARAAAEEFRAPGESPMRPGLHALRSWLHLLAGCTFVFYIAMLPTVCGAMAFAEENHLGSRPWQLSQPIELNRQWLIKLATALATSVCLGLVMPLMFLLVVELLGAGGLMVTDWQAGVVSRAITVHFFLFGLAACTASWSRTTVTAILKTLAFLIGLMLLTRILSYRFHYYVPLDWPLLAWPVAVTALLFTLPNFKQLEGSRGSRILQCGLLVALATVVAMGNHTID